MSMTIGGKHDSMWFEERIEFRRVGSKEEMRTGEKEGRKTVGSEKEKRRGPNEQRQVLASVTCGPCLGQRAKKATQTDLRCEVRAPVSLSRWIPSTHFHPHPSPLLPNITIHTDCTTPFLSLFLSSSSSHRHRVHATLVN